MDKAISEETSSAVQPGSHCGVRRRSLCRRLRNCRRLRADKGAWRAKREGDAAPTHPIRYVRHGPGRRVRADQRLTAARDGAGLLLSHKRLALCRGDPAVVLRQFTDVTLHLGNRFRKAHTQATRLLLNKQTIAFDTIHGMFSQWGVDYDLVDRPKSDLVCRAVARTSAGASCRVASSSVGTSSRR